MQKMRRGLKEKKKNGCEKWLNKTARERGRKRRRLWVQRKWRRKATKRTSEIRGMARNHLWKLLLPPLRFFYCERESVLCIYSIWDFLLFASNQNNFPIHSSNSCKYTEKQELKPKSILRGLNGIFNDEKRAAELEKRWIHKIVCKKHGGKYYTTEKALRKQWHHFRK